MRLLFFQTYRRGSDTKSVNVFLISGFACVKFKDGDVESLRGLLRALSG